MVVAGCHHLAAGMPALGWPLSDDVLLPVLPVIVVEAGQLLGLRELRVCHLLVVATGCIALILLRQRRHLLELRRLHRPRGIRLINQDVHLLTVGLDVLEGVGALVHLLILVQRMMQRSQGRQTQHGGDRRLRAVPLLSRGQLSLPTIVY